MTVTNKKGTQGINRKLQILQTLAWELEQHPGQRITTSALARSVGVSEAALYRHFPSKAKMLEALIEFSETSVFGLINQVLTQEQDVFQRVEKIIAVILGFAAKNPGITRVLLGEVLIGEHERLLKRIEQFFQRIETQLKQILREGELKKQFAYHGNVSLFAEVLSGFVQGQMCIYVRSQFKRSPLEHWPAQWRYLIKALNE